MAQVGLHAYLALKLKNKTSNRKWFLFSFILGSIIPDLDVLVTMVYCIFNPILDSIILTHRTFSHSVFTFILVYLIFLIIYEITNKKKYLTIANGLMMGSMFHLLIDIFFWFESIHLFWPLPIDKLNIWKNINFDRIWLNKILLLSEFIFFRLFIHKIIDVIINFPNDNGKYLNQLSFLKKIQIYFFIIFGIIIYLTDGNTFYYIFCFMYITSITLIIYYLYKSRESFNEFSINKYKVEIKDLEKRPSISNIE